jgi:hypothetical protein
VFFNHPQINQQNRQKKKFNLVHVSSLNITILILYHFFINQHKTKHKRNKMKLIKNNLDSLIEVELVEEAQRIQYMLEISELT